MAASRLPPRSSSRLINIWGSRTGAYRFKRERFDVDSGQVFTEMVVRAPGNTRQVGERSRIDTIFDEARRRRSEGAPSLEDVAIRSFLRNVDSVTSETLMGLPWEIGVRLWKKVEELDLARPSVWSAFAAAYPEEEQFQYYRSSEITPSKTFSEYVEFLGCPCFEWLTCLTLSKINLERVDIMRVSELSNIVAMDIYSSGSDLDQDHGVGISVVDDQVLRNWGRRAQESGSFSKLRVILLRNQRHLTARSLEYLCAFPQLALFGVSGCSVSARHEETAERHGWTLDDDRGILKRIKSDIDMSHTWDGALSACVKYSGRMLHDHLDAEIKDPPILSYRLGPTSSNVLYSVPLVFFRCFGRKSGTELLNLDSEAEGDTIEPSTSTSQSQVSHGHLDKKRKIKVSAQRSFDSTLADLGIEITHANVPAKSHSDPTIDEVNDTRSLVHTFPKPSSSPATPSNSALLKRRQARQERERPWRQSPGDKT